MGEITARVGNVLGDFRLTARLASGGMGDLYRAERCSDGRPTAVKVLRDVNPVAMRRFLREYRVASGLDHECVVEVFDQGVAEDGTAWIAMELLEGEDLAARLGRGPVPVGELVAIVLRVIGVLGEVHDHGVVHRDLKPENIFLPAGGEPLVKLLDFGVARLADEQSITGTGVLVGTVSYMSPEQARAQPHVGPASDQWSLGVILYYALSGRLPFDAPGIAGTLFRIVYESPQPLSELCPWVSEPLLDIVARALARQPEDRFEDIRAMGRALGALPADALATRPSDPFTYSQASADTVASAARSTGTADQLTTVERRLTTVVWIEGVQDPGLLRRVAEELHGELTELRRAAAMVVFGHPRWRGDECARAARLAASLVASTDGVGVATARARCTLSEVAGEPLEVASSLAARGGAWLDRATAASARRVFDLDIREDGTARVGLALRERTRAREPSEELAPFIGRDRELRSLLALADELIASETPVSALVVGPGGAGKTRLAEEARQQLERMDANLKVLSGRCDLGHRDVPFGGLVAALRDHADEALLRALDVSGEGDPQAARDRAMRLAESLLRETCSAGVAVLIMDDAQWMDPASIETLSRLLERVDAPPIALWLLARPEGREPLSRAFLPASTMALGPLPRRAAVALLQAIAGAAPEPIVDRAAGMPLFLTELGRVLARLGPEAALTELPASVEGALLAELDRLDSSEREFLKRLAIFEGAASLDAVGALGVELPSVARLRRAGMVAVERGAGGETVVRFRSEGCRQVAYGLWAPEVLAELHAVAATWLGEHGAPPEQTASHWDRAGDPERAAADWALGAARAARVSGVDRVLVMVERVLASTDRPEPRFLALAAADTALMATARHGERAHILEQLAEVATTLGPTEVAEAGWRAAAFARITGDASVCRLRAAQAVQESGRGGDPRHGARAAVEVALLEADAGDLAAAARLAGDARVLAEQMDDEWLVARVRGVQAYVLLEQGMPLPALELFESAAAGFGRAGDRRRQAIVLGNAGDALLDLGRIDEAAELISRASSTSADVGNTRTVAVAAANLALIARIRGEFGEARSLLAEAEHGARALRHGRLLGAVLCERILLALGSMDHEALLAAVDSGERGATSIDVPSARRLLDAALLRARVRLGRSDLDCDPVREGLREVEPAAHAAIALRMALFDAGCDAAEQEAQVKRALEVARARAALDPDAPDPADSFGPRHLLPDAWLARSEGRPHT